MAGGAFSDRGRDSSSQLRQMAITFCYCSIMAINGGTVRARLRGHPIPAAALRPRIPATSQVGAFGPALETFERNTKLPQVAIGTAVLIHRLAKLGGTIVWGWYASLLQKRREQGVRLSLSPHVLMSASLLVTGVSSVLLGVTKSKRTFQVAMGVAGFCYGITDSACNLLVLWAWQHDTRRQRCDLPFSQPSAPAHAPTHAPTPPPACASQRARGDTQRALHLRRLHHADAGRGLATLYERRRVACFPRTSHLRRRSGPIGVHAHAQTLSLTR